MALVLRLQKGSSLTNEELDANFVYLDEMVGAVQTSLDNAVDVVIPALEVSLETQLNDKQDANANLTSLSDVASNGLLSISGNTITPRTITGSGGVSVSNGDGVSGNPSISLDSSVVKTVAEQTLTNKTISGTSNSLTDISVESLTGVLPIAKGGTGASSTGAARVGLGALKAPATNGLVVQTAEDTTTTRSIQVSGVGLNVSNPTGAGGNPTIISNATSANVASAVVARDANGNFSAGTISATLNGTAANALQVQNGVYTNESYNNPNWLIGLAGSKVSNIPNSSLQNDSITIDGVEVALGGSITGVIRREAWVKFTGGVTPTIIASRNVVSVVRTAIGRFTINLTPGTFLNQHFIASGMASDNDHVITYASSTSNSLNIIVTDPGVGNQNYTDSNFVMVTMVA